MASAQGGTTNKKALSQEQVDRILKITQEVVAISAAVIGAIAGVRRAGRGSAPARPALVRKVTGLLAGHPIVRSF